MQYNRGGQALGQEKPVFLKHGQIKERQLNPAKSYLKICKVLIDQTMFSKDWLEALSLLGLKIADFMHRELSS